MTPHLRFMTSNSGYNLVVDHYKVEMKTRVVLLYDMANEDTGKYGTLEIILTKKDNVINWTPSSKKLYVNHDNFYFERLCDAYEAIMMDPSVVKKDE